MKHLLVLLALLLLSTLTALHGAVEAPQANSSVGIVAPFQSGDRWCVLGDSITHAGSYHRDIELFYLTRFPSLKLDVINCGISGDTSVGAEKRLPWDCLNAKPTVVTVMLGMNDVQRDLYAVGATGPEIEKKRKNAAETYDASMRRLLRALKNSGAKVVCILPTPFDDTVDLPIANLPGCDAGLQGLGQRVGAMAGEFQLPLIDFHGPLASINAEKQKSDPHFTIIGPDRVHPKEPGHLFMAAQFLKAQHLEGPVSRIDIDASAKRPGKLENCEVGELSFSPDAVSFTCDEHALPFPVPEKAKPALELIPFMKDFDQETLRVTGLAPGDYELKIDGQVIRGYTAAELEAGVNLAKETSTPQYRQALDVLSALGRKWDAVDKIRTINYVEFSSWPEAPRPVDPLLLKPKLEAQLAAAAGKSYQPYIRDQQKKYAEFKALEAEFPGQVEDAVIAARRAAVTKPHQFTLTRLALKPAP